MKRRRRRGRRSEKEKRTRRTEEEGGREGDGRREGGIESLRGDGEVERGGG